MQDKFTHSARLKMLKNFKHDVVMDLMGNFQAENEQELQLWFQGFP